MDYKDHWWKSQWKLKRSEEIPFNVVTCIIAIFGFMGNLALLMTYMKKDRKIRFNRLMLLIASFNLLCLTILIIKLIMFFGGSASLSDKDGAFQQFLQFVHDFSFSGSVCLTALIALERYLLLCKDQ